MYIETLNDVNFNKSWKNGLVLKPLTGSVGINREYIFNFESICKYLLWFSLHSQDKGRAR